MSTKIHGKAKKIVARVIENLTLDSPRSGVTKQFRELCIDMAETKIRRQMRG